MSARERTKGVYLGERRRVASGWLGWDAYDEVDMGFDSPCWIYRKKPTGRGYAQMKMPDGSQPCAHRAFYEYHVGVIPPGLTLDHLCRIRNCVNPAHLEPVSRGENVLRGDTAPAANAAKTHCPKGHPYDEQNTRHTPQGGRVCRACARERRRAQRNG